MLALLFYLGDIKYAISCDKVREVVPLVSIKTISHAPEYFAGFFNYRGEIVPVIDLRKLIQGVSCRMRMSSRIILVDHMGKNKAVYTLGLMAEQVTDTFRCSGKILAQSASVGKAPFMGGIIMEEMEVIQHINPEALPDCIEFLPLLPKDNKSGRNRD